MPILCVLDQPPPLIELKIVFQHFLGRAFFRAFCAKFSTFSPKQKMNIEIQIFDNLHYSTQYPCVYSSSINDSNCLILETKIAALFTFKCVNCFVLELCMLQKMLIDGEHARTSWYTICMCDFKLVSWHEK